MRSSSSRRIASVSWMVRSSRRSGSPISDRSWSYSICEALHVEYEWSVLVGGALAPRVFPADPVRTVGAVLALPDGQPCLDAIDQLAARAERFSSVRGARGAGDGRVADAERPGPMRRCHTDAGHLALQLREDLAELALGHRLVRFV